MNIKNLFRKKEAIVEEPIVEKKPEINNITKSVEKTVKKIKSVKAINPLVDACYKAIDKEVAKEFRDEAKEIIDLSSEEIRNEFIKYFKEGSGNVCCLILDKAKRDLITEGKLVSKENDAFGHPFML